MWTLVKHLPTLFTVVETPLIVLSALVHAVCLLAPLVGTQLDDRRLSALLIALQSFPFTLLGIHFFYRYLAVRRPELLQMFSKKSIRLLLNVGILGTERAVFRHFSCLFGTTGESDSAGTRAVIAECELKYGNRIEHAWIILDHWRDNKLDVIVFTTVVVMNVIKISSLISAASLASFTFTRKKRSKIENESSTEEIPNCALRVARFFHEADVPYIFQYIPFLLCVNIPFFRIPITFMHDWSITLLSCYPACDAAVMILLITDYRRGLQGMIMKKRTGKIHTLSNGGKSSYRSHSSLP
uniref:G protein-coupled receptor n=1 Tax=Pristionchus pacificus TaxID=54126 RepID=A0A8R1YZ08_PRIPA